MKLGIPVYQGVNLLDVSGPLEMFYWAGQRNALEAVLVSSDGNSVTSINNIRFEPHASFAQTPTLDILWVPGGSPEALVTIMRSPNSQYLQYLRQIAARAKWVCSVCEGALLLARAGLLDGHIATTHWAFVKCLQRFPAIQVDTTNPRFVVSGNRLTGGNIRPIRHSVGRKMALNKKYCQSVTIRTLELKQLYFSLNSSVPVLAALLLCRDAGGIADLDPDRAWPGSIGAVGAFRDDAFSTDSAGMFEHRRAIPGDVFVEHDARLGIAQQSRQRGLAVEKRAIAQILAIALDQVEGIEDRLMRGRSSTQFLAADSLADRPSLDPALSQRGGLECCREDTPGLLPLSCILSSRSTTIKPFAVA
jgi:putative intracellular protease/amidase